MKKKAFLRFSIIIAFALGAGICCLFFFFIRKDEKEKHNSTRVSEATVIPSLTDYSSKFVGVFGKWRVIERIGSGYAFTDIPEKSYIGGEITITDELVQCSMPDKELNYTIKDPKYVMQWQSRNDFYMEHYANYDSFGFEDPEKVPKIEIKKKGQSLGFGSELWIKDENHIIIMGPQYFLAEKQSN